MAFFELNALSTILCGSFSARVFLPEMDRLWLDDGAHTRKYPVLWLLHDEGNASVDWQRSPAEQCAADAGIFIIAPDVQHALGTNMVYGPKYENFMYTELQGICRNLFPIAPDPEKNWIGGTGTGAYGAVKIAMKHPDVFSKAFSLGGVLDLGKIFERATAGEPTGIHHRLSSLKAVFGDPNAFAGSENDLWGPGERNEDEPLRVRAGNLRPEDENAAGFFHARRPDDRLGPVRLHILELGGRSGGMHLCFSHGSRAAALDG